MKLLRIEETRVRWQSQIDDKTTLNLGAFFGARLIGNLNFRMFYADHPWLQHLGQFGMMVLEEHWGKGIGKQFLRIQEAYAVAIGVNRIEATVRVTNERGLKLYEHAGYRIEGTRRQAAQINGELHS